MKILPCILGSSAGLILAFIITDCSVGTSKNYSAIVIDKIHEKAWTETWTTTDSEGHIQIHTTHHPEVWQLFCSNTDGPETFKVDVTENKYMMISNNQSVVVTTKQGKFTKVNYLPHITHP